jgi:hypothetical protein
MILLNAFSFGTPEIFVGQAPTKFDEKTLELKDEITKKLVAQQLAGFAKFIERVKAWPARAIATPQASYDHIDLIGWCGLAPQALPRLASRARRRDARGSWPRSIRGTARSDSG